MSSYSCAIPVNWNLLWEELLPAWLSVLDGTLASSTFYERYVPHGDQYGDLLTDRFSTPEDFLSLFGQKRLSPPYLRSELLQSGKCSAFLKTSDLHTPIYLLQVAIQQTAAVNFPGIDNFADNYLGHSCYRTWSVQVAGTKNLYRFLDLAFDVTWNPLKKYFAYTRKPYADMASLQNLLEALFLYERVLPGTWFSENSPIWPGFDDLSIAGYLSPIEVGSLSKELLSIGQSNNDEDIIFPIFVDRVNRAADCGCGLLTIHAGL